MDLIDVSENARMNNGICFILNVVDHFSKFAWSTPLKNKSVENVAFALQQIILVEGPPEVLSSDNGGEFTGDKMKQLCDRFNIDHRFSLPYRPQTNGAVERFNKTLKEAINKRLADHQSKRGADSKRYIDVLPFLVHSYNTHKHNTTKRTPFQVHRGRDVRISLLNSLVQEEIQKNADKMVADSMKKREAKEDPLEVGDSVRVDEFALKHNRKKADFQKRHVNNWSRERYEVAEIKEDEQRAGLMLHRLEPSPRGEKESRWFYRHQLFKVDEEALERPRAITDRVDLNFGAGGFDLERHLVEMPRRDRRVAELDESDLESDDEERKSGPRRTGRRGAGAGVASVFPMVPNDDFD